MDEGCSRSLVPVSNQSFTNPRYINKVNQGNKVLVLCRTSSFLLITALFSLACFSAAQITTSKNLVSPPADYTTSVVQLHVSSKTWSHLRSAHKEFREGNVRKAEEEVDRALQVDPACAPALSMKAFIDLAEKKPTNAVEDAAHAASIDSHDADAFVALAMAYNSLKDFQNASEAAQRALDIRPDSWQARLEMAKSRYGQGQFAVALHELEVVDKDFPDVHLVRGNVLMSLGRGQEAVEEFDLFLKQEPLDPRGEQIRHMVTMISPKASGANFTQK
jgi:tetratricopeptide (TPR) repeat protein